MFIFISGFSFGGSTANTGLNFNAGAPGTTSAFSFKGIGGTPASAPTGSIFGGQSSLGSSFGGFGTGASTNPVLGGTTFNQQPIIDQNVNLTNMATALSMPLVYNDDRDPILSKWNRVQAFWGFGKGYYSSSAAPLEFTPSNPFCRFKAIGYSRLPNCKNEQGFVSLIFNKKVSEIKNNQQQLVDSIHRILQSKPTLTVCVEGLKPIVQDKTEVTIYILERAPNGTSRCIPSTELYSFASQATTKTQFTNLGVQEIIPKAAPSADQLKSYLDSPPDGIDPLIWQQAKQDNPDPKNLIPVPMIGFDELFKRLKFQEQETNLHQGRLDLIAADISNVQKKHSTFVAKLEEHKRKQLELSHRVLKVMVKQEITRKLGFGIQMEEEQLRVHLEGIYSELNAPTQFKGRLSELMSQIRMQSQDQFTMRGADSCTLEPHLMDELKDHLVQQQASLGYLISIIKDDLEDVKLINSSLAE